MARRSHKRWLTVVAWIAVASLALASHANAQSEEFKRKHAEARVKLLKAQIALAEWCNSKELFLERDQIYQRVLSIDTDNPDARKGLRFARNPDGSWKAPPAREMKNRNAKALEALPAQKSQSVSAFRDEMIEALRQENADIAVRRSVYDEVLLFDPDDARVHELCSEVKVDDKWVLGDTARAKKGRGEIKALVQASREAVAAPDEIAATPQEIALIDNWTCRLAGPRIRVLSTGDAADCRAVYDACLAIQQVVNRVFEVDSKLPDDFAVYVLANEGERDRFVDHLIGMKDDERAFLKTLTSTSVHGGVHVVVWDPDPKIRLDNAVRHTLNHLLHEAFNATPKQGWIWEGLGLYLTRELISTRLTWFMTRPASDDATDVALRGVLATSETNWMSEALKVLDGESPPKVTTVLTHDVNELTAPEMVVVYAFSAYLLEARPDKAAHFVRRSCAGESPVELAQTILGFTSEELQARMQRWLKERK